MKEIFLPIKGFEGRYEISNLGNVKSLPRFTCRGLRGGKILKHILYKNGYYGVSLTGINSTRSAVFYIHRLIAEAFVPNSYNKPCINHIDGNKRNNMISNLEWCTYAENNGHAVNVGLNARCPKTGRMLGADYHKYPVAL